MDYVGIGTVCGGRVGVGLVTPEPGGRGTARVELSAHGARYPYKLSAAEARSLAESLLEAADQLAALPAAAPTEASKRPPRERVRYPKFVPPSRPPELVGDLFALRDGEGNVWTLSVVERGAWWLTKLILQARGVVIEGGTYDIHGSCWLDEQGTLGKYPSVQVSVWPAGARYSDTPVPRWIINRAEARLSVLLASEAAAAMFPRAVEIAALPSKERQQVEADTHLGLADCDELRQHINRLKAWLEPGGGDSAPASVKAKIASIRPNSPRHRRRIQELRETLQHLDEARVEHERELAKYEARLAQITA